MDTLLAIDCPRCGHQFAPVNDQQRYCSRQCQRSAEKARARARVPKKRCASCGDEKPSRKGDYCGKPECARRSSLDSWRRHIDARRHQVNARDRERDREARARLNATRGPRPRCRTCGTDLNQWNATYCQSPECQSESKREYNRAYYTANQDAHRSRASRYRALRRGTATEPVNVATIYERDRWRCGLCSKRIDQALSYPHPMSRSIDHIVPLSCGGTHTAGNLQAAHLRCNVAKGNRGGGEQLALL